MPTLNLSPAQLRTDTIGSAPPSGAILAGRDHYGSGDCAGGVRFALPLDLSAARINSATLDLEAVEFNEYLSSYFLRCGVPANGVAFDSQDFADVPLTTWRQFISNHFFSDPPSEPYDEILTSNSIGYSLDFTDLLNEAAAAGRLIDNLQVAFRLGYVADDQWDPFWAEFSAFEIEIDYTILPIRLVLPETIRVGQVLPASVIRLDAEPTPLEVTLGQSPSGRLILPSTVTIAADETEEEFAIEGASVGAVNVTATAGTDEHDRDVTVLSAPPVGLGDEIGWWCPSLDDDGDGTATVYDLSGLDHHGTLLGTAPGDAWEENGGARCLHLQNGYINIGHYEVFDFERTDPFSLAAWVFIPAGHTAGIDLLAKLQSASPFRGYEIRINPSLTETLMHVMNTFGSNDLTKRVTFGTFNPLGAWRHIAISYDGSSTPGGLLMYWNGVLRSAGTVTNNLSSTIRNTVPLQIGARNSTGATTFRIDDVRMYARAITASEVAVLASARGVQGDGSSTGPAGPRRNRLRRHRINAGLIA
jgi:hypothetical protein